MVSVCQLGPKNTVKQALFGLTALLTPIFTPDGTGSTKVPIDNHLYVW
jgi:hypothetical protein